MTDALVLGLSIFGLTVTMGIIATFVYVMKVRLQWNFIAREAALASVNALKALAERLEDKRNRSAGISEPIKDEIARLLQK